MTHQFKNSEQASAMIPKAFLAVDMTELANRLFQFINQHRDQLNSSGYEQLVWHWKNLRSHAELIEYRRPAAHMLREFSDVEELLVSLANYAAETNNDVGASQ